MKTKQLENGFSMPVFGMGTWGNGGRETHDPSNDDAGQIRAMRAGLDAGITLIDTAEAYAAGYAETLTGQAIAPYARESLFLTGKVWKTHLTRAGVAQAAEESLRRLGTDYFDLYLYHQVSEEVPLEETIPAMNELVTRGLTRYIGVSNFAPARLKRAMDCSDAPIVVNQVHYNLKYREPELGLLDFCRTHDVMLQAWRPLRDLKPCALTDELCEKYAISFPKLALAWLLEQKSVTTLSAMRNPAHIPENLAALNVTLSSSDHERLTREFPDQSHVSKVPLS